MDEEDDMGQQTSPGLLLLPGWDDDSRQQFNALKADLQRDGWICRRAFLPDRSWPPELRRRMGREHALRQTLDDHYELRCSAGGPIAVLCSSFGAYIGAYLAAARPVEWLVLRSPALYPDEDWWASMEELDKCDVSAWHLADLRPARKGALAACARFRGDVLLVEAERDAVIPPQVISAYEASFLNARSLTRHTLSCADHRLTDPAWQIEYHAVAAAWLRERVRMHMHTHAPGISQWTQSGSTAWAGRILRLNL